MLWNLAYISKKYNHKEQMGQERDHEGTQWVFWAV